MKISSELLALSIISATTALMWLPYVLARLVTRGRKALANIDPREPPDPMWADRAYRAHRNAIENLAVFAPVVLVAALIGLSTSAPVTASWVYVVSRIAHYVLYTAGVPYARTIAFFVGVSCVLVIALAIMGQLVGML